MGMKKNWNHDFRIPSVSFFENLGYEVMISNHDPKSHVQKSWLKFACPITSKASPRKHNYRLCRSLIVSKIAWTCKPGCTKKQAK